MKRDIVFDAEALVKIHQIDAAAQQDVLAVVDGFRIDFVGGRASAQERAGFEELHRMAGGAEGGGGRESGQTSADDDRLQARGTCRLGASWARTGKRLRRPPPPPLMISMASQMTMAMNSTSEGSSPMGNSSMTEVPADRQAYWAQYSSEPAEN